MMTLVLLFSFALTASAANSITNRLKGRLLLQVEKGGAIWYVDINGIRHNVRWNNLMDLFTRLALGITDKDLAEVGEDLLTYRNSGYGFEFKHPSTSNWVEDRTRSTTNELVFVGVNNIESKESIKVQDSQEKSLDGWRSVYESDYHIVSVASLTIGGEKAYKLTSTEFGQIFIIAVHNGYLYTITTTGGFNDSILSTFKFLD